MSFTKLISVTLKAEFHQLMKSTNLLITPFTNNYCNIYGDHIKSPMSMLIHIRIVSLECSKLTIYFIKLDIYYTYIGNIRILEYFNTDNCPWRLVIVQSFYELRQLLLSGFLSQNFVKAPRPKIPQEEKVLTLSLHCNIIFNFCW